MAGCSYYLLNSQFQISVLLFLFTLIYYNFCGILSVKNYQYAMQNSRLSWISRHLTEILFVNMGLGIVAMLIFYKLYNLGNIDRFDTYLFICILLSSIYIFTRHIPILKNIIIACVWTLAMHIGSSKEFTYLDIFIWTYLLALSIWYDRTVSQIKKALIDCLIVVPFLIAYIY